MKKPVIPCRLLVKQRHLSQSKNKYDDDEDDDKGSSKDGKAKIIVKLKMSSPANF